VAQLEDEEPMQEVLEEDLGDGIVESTRMSPRGGVNRRFKTFTSGLTNAE
jgi:hypothetical protein